MDDLLKHLGGAGMKDGEVLLAWSVGIVAGIGVAVLLLLAII